MNLLKDIGDVMKRIRGAVYALGIGVLLGLSGCTDELEIVNNQGGGVEEEEGDVIAFTIEVNRSLSSRSTDEGGIGIPGYSIFTDQTEAYENYIDTQDKFRVFFFSEEGDFLFGATDRTVSSLLNAGANKDFWYIRIPMSMLVDRENREYDIEKIKSYLKTHKFKVAVLANWPNGGEKINPADWDDSEGTNNAIDNPSSTLKGNPRWDWSNSILNINAQPADIKNINDLHHVYHDLYYGDATRFPVYGSFMDYVSEGDDAGYYMGEPTDWVKMRNVTEGWNKPGAKDMVDVNGNGGFESKTEANRWIRANWTPDVNLNQYKQIYRHYQHMWFLWNFDASFKTGHNGNPEYDTNGNVTSVTDNGYYKKNWGWNDGGAEECNQFGKEWYKRNGDILYQWMKASYNNGGTPRAIGGKIIDIGESNNSVFFRYNSKTDAPAYCVNVNGNYGIHLPNLGTEEVTVNTQGTISFEARTSGTLRIKWGSLDGTTSGLAVKVDKTIRTQRGITSTDPINWSYTDNLGYWDVVVEGNAEPVSIYCVQGKAVVYSIEFIRGRYLYETDREGVAPHSKQGIPMYGVELFDKIPDWQRGTTITLPNTIAMIRALAKVEVYIKSDFGMPRHVFMRNMNRLARCEPMNVEKPTSLSWNDNHSEIVDNKLNGVCEWFRIQKYGPSYKHDGGTVYSDWLSWLYGSWKKAKWKTDGYEWNYTDGYYKPKGAGNEHKGWTSNNFSYSSYNTDDLTPPDLFNPYYYRNDFCRFLSGGEEPIDKYYKFVLYVPEKNIEDPSSVGDMNSIPRVPHIEYRFAPKVYNPSEADIDSVDDDPYSNTEYNLDDNDCYRIYFTNYGYASNSTASENVNDVTLVNEELYNKRWNSTTYDNYEQHREYLKYHWPIMRNHCYQFYVGGDGPKNPEIRIKVLDWSHGKVVMEW